MITHLAGNDAPDYELHLAAIKKVIAAQRVTNPLNWNPREALELERWNRPTSLDNHLRRTFACAALIDAWFNADERDRGVGLSDIVAPMVESATVLGPDCVRNARRTLAAFLGQLEGDWEEDPLFAGLGLLVLVAALADEQDQHIAQALCEWVWSENLRLETRSGHLDKGRSLLALTPFDQYHDAWQSLTRKHLLESDLPYDKHVIENVRKIGADMMRWTSPAA